MQGLFGALQHHAAMAVDDGFGITGRARGIDDPDRMREGDLQRGGRLRVGQKGGPIGPAIPAALRAHHDLGVQAGQFLGDIVQNGAAIIILAAVSIAVLGDQHLGLDLTEPVQDRDLTHIRGA